MIAAICIALTFAFFVATLYFATQGRVEHAQIAGGLAFVSFGACLAIDGFGSGNMSGSIKYIKE